MNKQPAKLTPFKAITGIIAALLIIGICIISIIQEVNSNQTNSIWGYVILIGLACIFLIIIILAFIKIQKDKP